MLAAHKLLPWRLLLAAQPDQPYEPVQARAAPLKHLLLNTVLTANSWTARQSVWATLTLLLAHSQLHWLLHTAGAEASRPLQLLHQPAC
jgi:hypothetical protein